VLEDNDNGMKDKDQDSEMDDALALLRSGDIHIWDKPLRSLSIAPFHLEAKPLALSCATFDNVLEVRIKSRYPYSYPSSRSYGVPPGDIDVVSQMVSSDVLLISFKSSTEAEKFSQVIIDPYSKRLDDCQ
jgi:hypothetical protein